MNIPEFQIIIIIIGPSAKHMRSDVLPGVGSRLCKLECDVHDILTSDLHKKNNSCTVAVYVCTCLGSCAERSCRRFLKCGQVAAEQNDLGEHRSSIRSSRMVVSLLDGEQTHSYTKSSPKSQPQFRTVTPRAGLRLAGLEVKAL